MQRVAPKQHITTGNPRHCNGRSNKRARHRCTSAEVTRKKQQITKNSMGTTTGSTTGRPQIRRLQLALKDTLTHHRLVSLISASYISPAFKPEGWMVLLENSVPVAPS
ncbi:hypothetical protein HETIRDRAFT_148687 [Heterobasidion irregulare TC 32-1]|uniref:Uncharacterized protein n=1 Tax=Heterobasidion irregulare (strain TC 32-1) TaxID=747525 RepID=W4JXQ4_HETIT|nr:uncharacterized protein HETIRDRAFT_148687 [Heterobasidion irregulare TC 32-1]ETW77855.1 hypothetical protein HETIRDRAFT_148687 [Heterobasidion irregulare TC 32-1]